MRRLLAIALLTATAALPVRAQVPLRWPATTAPLVEESVASGAEAKQASTLLPVVNRTTGDFEAFLLVEPVAATAVPGLNVLPTRLGYAPRTPALHRRNLWRGAGGARLDAGLRLEMNNNVALLCDGPSGLLQSLDGLSRHCALATLDASNDPLLRYAPALGLDLGIDAGRFQFDLSASAQRLSRGALSADDRQVPSLNLVAADAGDRWLQRPLPAQPLVGLRLDQVDIGGNAMFRLGEQGWLAIGGSVARARLIASTNALFRNGEWIRRDLAVTGGWGAFSGYVGGHSLSGLDGGRFAGLDVGVSWRTPWNGLLSVGAENLISSGDARAGLNQSGSSDERQSSTPYVRYRQDL